MLFSSLDFLAGFLPLVLCGAYLLGRIAPRRAVLAFLLVASLVFYGWHHPPHLALLLLSILVNHLIGRSLAARRAPAALAVGVAANLALLGWFKYAGFFGDTLRDGLGVETGLHAVLLPLAISFFTFQQIGYLADIHRRVVAPAPLLDYAFFVSFFPQLIAGPIIHWREVGPQLSRPRFAGFAAADLAAGLLLFSVGLAKKALLADQFAPGADRLFEAVEAGAPVSAAEAWAGMLCYSFQIYFDFSGYSDMALGLGRMFGLSLPANFLSPYKASSITAFWRRWNITLSHFLRDYLYLPLGGNRRGPVRRYANLFIVMLLGGLWHGASWTFVAWGGLHGAFLGINHAWRRFAPLALPAPVGVALTFLAALIAWVFFRAGDFAAAQQVLGAMAGLSAAPALSLDLLSDMIGVLWLLPVGAALIWAAPNALEVVAAAEAGGFATARARRIMAMAALLAALSLFRTYAAGSHEFIYFQF